jgi:uncharacterized protein YegL
LELLFEVVKNKWNKELEFKDSLDNKALALAGISGFIFSFFGSVYIIILKENIFTELQNIIIPIGLVFSVFSILLCVQAIKITKYHVGRKVEKYKEEGFNEEKTYIDFVTQTIDNYEKGVNKNKQNNEQKSKFIKFAFSSLLIRGCCPTAL